MFCPRCGFNIKAAGTRECPKCHVEFGEIIEVPTATKTGISHINFPSSGDIAVDSMTVAINEGEGPASTYDIEDEISIPAVESEMTVEDSVDLIGESALEAICANSGTISTSDLTNSVVCLNCGTPNEMGSKFCIGCGTFLENQVLAPRPDGTLTVEANDVQSAMNSIYDVPESTSSGFADKADLGTRQCPSCGFENDPQNSFCIGCGNKLEAIDAETPVGNSAPSDQIPVIQETEAFSPISQTIICPSCGYSNSSEYRFCISCGSLISQ